MNSVIFLKKIKKGVDILFILLYNKHIRYKNTKTLQEKQVLYLNKFYSITYKYTI